MNNLTLKSIALCPQPDTLNLSPEVCQKLKQVGLTLDVSVEIGRNLMFEKSALLRPNSSVDMARIAAYSYSGKHSTIATSMIGRYCSIGFKSEVGIPEHLFSGLTTSLAVVHNCYFMNFSGYIPLRRNQVRDDGKSGSIINIGHDVWVGCHCLFPKDVTIGHGAVIGAGSIITHDVPPYAIVAGVGGGANSKGIIKGYRFPDEIISDLLELSWWDYDIPKMIAQGVKVPLYNIKDFISFMKNEEQEKLIPLPEDWYYLHVIDSDTVEVYHVDPEQTYMGSVINSANIAIINDPERGAEPIVIKTQD